VRVAVGPDTRLRRIPPEMGARLSRWRESAPEGAGADRSRAMRPGGGAGGGSEDLIDRLPTTTLAEVKPGDRVLVASTRGADPGKLNAIALVAGLESLAPPRAAGGRFGRGGESELPPELMDLGMSIP
jgi:hypothetical protein